MWLPPQIEVAGFLCQTGVGGDVRHVYHWLSMVHVSALFFQCVDMFYRFLCFCLQILLNSKMCQYQKLSKETNYKFRRVGHTVNSISACITQYTELRIQHKRDLFFVPGFYITVSMGPAHLLEQPFLALHENQPCINKWLFKRGKIWGKTIYLDYQSQMTMHWCFERQWNTLYWCLSATKFETTMQPPPISFSGSFCLLSVWLVSLSFLFVHCSFKSWISIQYSLSHDIDLLTNRIWIL